MNIARKSMAPLDFKLDEKGAVRVAFSRLNVIDHDGDVTRPGAIPTKAVAMSDYGHTSWEGAKPVGRGDIREDGDLGIFDGRFFLSTDHGRNAYETVKEMGDLQEWSYGYLVLDGGPAVHDGQNVRELRKLDIWEVSPVLKGAGIQTTTLAIKGGTPGPEMPWLEHLSWYRDVSSAFLDHATARDAMREAEGRKLSRSDRAGLTEQRATLAAILAHLDELLAEPQDPKAAQRARTTLLVEIERARALGVPI